ncbi:MAG: DNA-binding protein [Candidatus ainarchaeum sp.]|nr:DNA-binding protein [Candidatus ainarchaeum sp.]
MNERPEESNSAKQEKIEAELEEGLRMALTQEAKMRLGNVKLVNQELYYKAVQAILYLVKSGRISGKIDEAQIKQLLEKLSVKREISIRRR